MLIASTFDIEELVQEGRGNAVSVMTMKVCPTLPSLGYCAMTDL
ncbi:hypothetical protein [Rodentibacter rarus]|nr:hypothetical protein [Rodentibacter rarus]